MTQRETPPPKKDVARTLLLRGSVFVYLDPRSEGVAVPKWLADQPQLVLQVGLDLPVPIPDLRVDDAGVLGTLSFNRAPFTCIVPWSAVFALWGDDGMGMVWPEDMPPEVAAEVEQATRQAGKDAPPKSKAPRLRAIEGGASGSSRPPASLSEVPAPPPEAPLDQEDEAPTVAVTSEQDEQDEPTAPEESERRLPPYLRVIK